MNMNKFKTALLISTYNWPDALSLIFKSIMKQSRLPDEILIADDGSKEDTKNLILQFKEKCNIPVKHFWQEDSGFRKSKILNKAIAGSEADYIIQVDGDCILHKHLIKDHILNACPDQYLYGSRVNIRKEYVDDVFKNESINFNLFSTEIKNKTRALYIPFLAKRYKSYNHISSKLRGCNISFWKKNFIAINGYNEDFEGWGMEDSEMAIRLHNNGFIAKRLRYIGIVFHIYHQVKSKENVLRNEELEQHVLETHLLRCEKGVDQYL